MIFPTILFLSKYHKKIVHYKYKNPLLVGKGFLYNIAFIY